MSWLDKNPFANEDLINYAELEKRIMQGARRAEDKKKALDFKKKIMDEIYKSERFDSPRPIIMSPTGRFQVSQPGPMYSARFRSLGGPLVPGCTCPRCTGKIEGVETPLHPRASEQRITRQMDDEAREIEAEQEAQSLYYETLRRAQLEEARQEMRMTKNGKMRTNGKPRIW